MTKVEIEPLDGGGYRLLLDGVDISYAIAAGGVRIVWEQDFPRVYLTLGPAEVWASLPDAVVTAVEGLREGDVAA